MPRRLMSSSWLAVGALLLAACSSSSNDGNTGTTPPPPPPPPAPDSGPAACAGGMADGFECSGVDLQARLSNATMGGTAGNDIWGWVDSSNGDEYALMGMTDGTAFVDISDPDAPVVVGRLPTQTSASTWRDIKVYRDHAYIVADGAGAHGMQVFDLTRLRSGGTGQTFAADVVYSDFTNAHNLGINEDSGFAYAVGTNTCTEGLHMIDISTPNNPLFAGCHEAADVHDVVCVDYAGPDTDHTGAEICFSSGSDRVEIADVSNKSAPASLAANFTYPGLGFVHQAWPTDDHEFLLVGDEFDEINNGGPTRTHVIDVRDLDNPAFAYTYESPATTSIDHNLYIVGNRVYQANYTTGLRVLEFSDLDSQDLSEVAFFDTYPDNDGVSFDGAWSVYPFFPSGNIIVSDKDNGLFVLTVP